MGEYIHSQQVQFTRSPASCGILEVHHLPASTTGSQMVFAVANQLYHKANGRPAAFILFSDVVDKQDRSRGELLAQSILDLGFVDLYISARAINPRTGNSIITWLWTVDHDKFRDWYTQEYANRVDA